MGEYFKHRICSTVNEFEDDDGDNYISSDEYEVIFFRRKASLFHRIIDSEITIRTLQ